MRTMGVEAQLADVQQALAEALSSHLSQVDAPAATIKPTETLSG
jgi:hypothetical protein